MHLRLTERQAVTALFVLGVVGSALAAITISLPTGNPLVIGGSVATFLVYSGLLWAYRRGWQEARLVVIAFLTVVVGATAPEPYVTQQVSLMPLVPAVFALITAGPGWIAGAGIGVLVAFVIRGGVESPYLQPMYLVPFLVSILGMAVVRVVLATSAAEVWAALQQARAERAAAEAASADVSARNLELAANNERQRQLLEVIAALELPLIPLADGVLLAPVIGRVDDERAGRFTAGLLRTTHSRRISAVILDLTGVQAAGGTTAEFVRTTTRTARLLGTRVIVSGIPASLALELAEAEGGLSVPSVRTVEDALALAMAGGAKAPARALS